MHVNCHPVEALGEESVEVVPVRCIDHLLRSVVLGPVWAELVWDCLNKQERRRRVDDVRVG